MKKMLLISNSTKYGLGYLEHCEKAILNILQDIDEIIFIPYALKDHDSYAKIVTKKFAKLGKNVISVHTSKNPQELIKNAKAVFIGGGNTFRLLNQLYKNNLIEIIRQRVKEGMPYIGTSAGSNMACPTIKTTNDMPIVQPPSFDAINLVPFQINPHYLDPDPNSKHMGETRDQRLKEYLEENDKIIVGLREGAWLWIEENSLILGGNTGAKIFTKNKEPEDYQEGDDLSFLL